MSWPVQVFTGPEYWLLQTWIIYDFIWWSTPCHLVPFNGTKHRSRDPFGRWTNLRTSTDLRMGIEDCSCSQVMLSITGSVIDLLFTVCLLASEWVLILNLMFAVQAADCVGVHPFSACASLIQGSGRGGGWFPCQQGGIFFWLLLLSLNLCIIKSFQK